MPVARNLISDRVTPEARRAIGDVIRRARVAARLPQSEAGRRLGMSAAMLCGIERGDKRLPLARVATFVEVLGIPPEHVARPPVVAADDDETALLEAFRHLPDDERRSLLELVRP